MVADFGSTGSPCHSSSDDAPSAVAWSAFASFRALLSLFASCVGFRFSPFSRFIVPRHSSGLCVRQMPVHLPPVSGQHQYHFLLLYSRGFFISSGFGFSLCQGGRKDFLFLFVPFFPFSSLGPLPPPFFCSCFSFASNAMIFSSSSVGAFHLLVCFKFLYLSTAHCISTSAVSSNPSS